MRKTGSRQKRKIDPRQNIVLIIIVVLAVLVGIAVVIQDKEKSRPEPISPQQPAVQPRVVRYAFPELLIRGCLFDLGISREYVQFSGKTVNVSLNKPPTKDQISKAFEPMKKVGEVSLEDATHLRLVINKEMWDIFFKAIPPGKLARCAIIVDDMGLAMKAARELGSINADITFAVLPENPDSQSVARYLHGKGREILLHLPMQGNGKDPGPGAIYKDMTPSQIIETVKRSLEAIPSISGVNNHMGSLITADEAIMRLVLSEVKERKLFFIDSLTTNKSICGPVAHDLGVPIVARDIFLDNERSSAYISSQIDQLVKTALKHSTAVAICHPYPETIAVLKKEIPRLKRRGVEVVRVSALMDTSESGQLSKRM